MSHLVLSVLTSRAFKGVGEIIRGNILAFMDSFVGGSSARKKDEDIAHTGEREIRDRQFDKARTWRGGGAM